MVATRERQTPTDDATDSATSSTRLRAVRQVKFYHSDAGALTAVEFELPPLVSLLPRVHEMLQSRKVFVVDSFMRLTVDTLYQRLHLSDQDGGPIFGARRRELEMVLIETLASLRDA